MHRASDEGSRICDKLILGSWIMDMRCISVTPIVRSVVGNPGTVTRVERGETDLRSEAVPSNLAQVASTYSIVCGTVKSVWAMGMGYGYSTVYGYRSSLLEILYGIEL